MALLEYFDEKDARRCEHCDICRKNNDSQLRRYEFDLIAENIREVIRHGKVLPGELVGMIDYPSEKTLQVMRWLLDNNKLIAGEGEVLKWKE